LIHGESEDAEHQMCHDFAAQANDTRSELVFQPAVDSFDHGALGKALFFSGRERKPFWSYRLGSFGLLLL